MSLNVPTVICVFNCGTGAKLGGGSFIEPCLNSFYATAGTGGELILVDDGSSDDSVALMRKFDFSLLIANTKNEGLRDSFNKAVDCVKSPFFIRADADVVFTQIGWDIAMLEHMLGHPECGVCGLTQLTSAGNIWSTGDALRPKYSHILERIPPGTYAKRESVMGCLTMFRRAAWDAVGGMNGPKWLRSETEDFNLRVAKAGYEIHCLPVEFQHHHQLAFPKSGEYNNHIKQRAAIQKYMWDQHNVDFYGERHDSGNIHTR